MKLRENGRLFDAGTALLLVHTLISGISNTTQQEANNTLSGLNTTSNIIATAINNCKAKQGPIETLDQGEVLCTIDGNKIKIGKILNPNFDPENLGDTTNYDSGAGVIASQPQENQGVPNQTIKLTPPEGYKINQTNTCNGVIYVGESPCDDKKESVQIASTEN